MEFLPVKWDDPISSNSQERTRDFWTSSHGFILLSSCLELGIPKKAAEPFEGFRVERVCQVKTLIIGRRPHTVDTRNSE